MKKKFFYLTILAGMLFFSLSSNAQQTKQTAASPKPPEVKGKKLEVDKTAAAADPVVSPAVPESSLPTAPAYKSSENKSKISKGNEPVQPTKANQTNPQPASVMAPRPVAFVTPQKAQTTIPDSKTSPGSTKIKE